MLYSGPGRVLSFIVAMGKVRSSEGDLEEVNVVRSHFQQIQGFPQAQPLSITMRNMPAGAGFCQPLVLPAAHDGMPCTSAHSRSITDLLGTSSYSAVYSLAVGGVMAKRAVSAVIAARPAQPGTWPLPSSMRGRRWAGRWLPPKKRTVPYRQVMIPGGRRWSRRYRELMGGRTIPMLMPKKNKTSCTELASQRGGAAQAHSRSRHGRDDEGFPQGTACC